MDANCGTYVLLHFRQYLYNLCEEVKYPEKIVPRTTVLSMCTVIFLYLLTNFCYMIVLTRRELVEADTVALVCHTLDKECVLNLTYNISYIYIRMSNTHLASLRSWFQISDPIANEKVEH